MFLVFDPFGRSAVQSIATSAGPGFHMADGSTGKHTWTPRETLQLDRHLVSHLRLQKTDKNGAGILGIILGFGVWGSIWVLFVFCKEISLETGRTPSSQIVNKRSLSFPTNLCLYNLPVGDGMQSNPTFVWQHCFFFVFFFTEMY